MVAKSPLTCIVFLLRPVRPTSLNLEQFVADNSSEVTGRTSGYSTSNDSDLEESREEDFEDEDLPISREEQVCNDVEGAMYPSDPSCSEHG